MDTSNISGTSGASGTSSSTAILLCSLLLCCSILLAGALLLYYFNPLNWFGLGIACKNPPCKVGEGCIGGQGNCATGLFCNSTSKCEAKRADGAFCPGVAGGDYCQSGKCGTLSTCLNSSGKAVENSSCSAVDQCADGLWCGGVPVKCRKPGKIGDYCVAGQHQQCQTGLYCDSTSKCAAPRDDGQGCFVDAGCKSGKCGKSLVCLTKDGKLPNFSGTCSTDSDCKTGSKCSGWGGQGVVCQPLSGVGESCTYSSGCKPGLACNGLSCYDPNDPCRCAATATPHTLCGDWDASGFQWCYVANGPQCAARGGSVTSGKGGYWKKCTGNF